MLKDQNKQCNMYMYTIRNSFYLCLMYIYENIQNYCNVIIKRVQTVI